MPQHTHCSVMWKDEDAKNKAAMVRTPSYNKVRTGCVTCKARKVKCDESKPSCKRCVRTGRACDGYRPPKMLLFESFEDRNQARYFRYFEEKSSLVLSHYQNSSAQFWSILALQMSHNHVAVKCMLTAFAAVQESFEQRCDGNSSTNQSKATYAYSLQQCSRASKFLTNSAKLDPPLEAVLACSILFTVYEILQNQSNLASLHLLGGMRIIQEFKCSTESEKRILASSDNVNNILVPLFSQLDLYLRVFADQHPSEEQWLPEEYTIEATLQVPNFFTDMPGATELMDNIFKNILLATEFPLTICKTARLQRLDGILAQYLLALETSLYALPQCPRIEYGIRDLMIHHRVAWIMLRTLSSTHEEVFDHYLDDFQYIISECSELLDRDTEIGTLSQQRFRICLGFIPPLFFTATRCRDSATRRRAIEVLHKSFRRERRWDSCTASSIAEKIMNIEEAGLKVPRKPHHTRELNRVRLFDMQFDPAIRCTRLHYIRWKPDGQEVIEQDLVRWPSDYSTDDLPCPEKNDKKIVRASGYTSLLLSCRTIQCRCLHQRGGESPSSGRYGAMLL